MNEKLAAKAAGLPIPQDPSVKPKLSQEERLKLIARAAELGISNLDDLEKAIRREQATRHLYDFIKQGWKYIDPAPFVDGFHIRAVCEHLEAVANGEIRHLLINMPPRCMKAIAISVALAPWVWIQRPKKRKPVLDASGRPMATTPDPPLARDPLRGPHVSFLYASYGQHLSLRDSIKARRLIESPWYKNNWPEVKLVGDMNTMGRFENSQQGYRLATSVAGSLTGDGGDYLVCDDIHNTVEIESQVTREGVLEWWSSSLATRHNNPQTGSFIVVMQRLHEMDLSGYILSKHDDNWCHLMLPMEYEPKRHCFTKIGWQDPRGLDDDGNLLAGLKTGLLEDAEVEPDSPIAEREGALLWPQRFREQEVEGLKKALGPHMAAGQLQQNPVPKGGGIIKEEWWQKFPPEDEEAQWVSLRKTWDEQAQSYIEREVLSYPTMEYVLCACDTAYGENQEADYSAAAVIGVWRDRNDNAKLMLMKAWQERLELHKLVAKIAATCKLGGVGKNAVYVDKLIVEAKASGKSVVQEIRRLFGGEKWVTEEHQVRGDKVARAYSIQPVFYDKMVYAPDREWAQLCIKESSIFPKGQHDDLPDAIFSAIRYLRDGGYLQLRRERRIETEEKMLHKAIPAVLYDC